MLMMEASNPALYGGKRIDLLERYRNLRCTIGASARELVDRSGAPVYQDLNGPQLGEAWQLIGALRTRF
jgi:hypothetical protein